MVGQVLDHLHAVVEDSGNFEHPGSAAQGLGKLLGRDLALGQEHHRGQGRAHVGRIEGRRGRGVAGGGADGQDVVPAVSGDQMAQIGVGAGHAAVLEGRRRVLSVVLEGHGLAHQTLQMGRGARHRGIAFSQVDDVFLGHHGGHELVKTEDAAQGRILGGRAQVENVAPGVAGRFFKRGEPGVLQQEHALAAGAGVVQLVNGVPGLAAEADIFHFPPVRGKNVGFAHEMLPWE